MKFTPGPFMAVGSGSIGGQTFSHNRFGPYARTRAIPTNPNTARQQAVRNIFQTLALVWSSVLTQGKRDAWNLYGSTVVVKDKLGQDVHWTGFNHFIRSNSVLLGVPLARVDDGPTTMTLGPTDPTIVATISEATQQISLVFDDTLEWCDENDAAFQIQMSSPVGSGRAYLPPIFRVAGFMEGASVTPPTSPQLFSTPFAVTEGQLVLVQCRIVRADARLSPPFQATSAIVA